MSANAGGNSYATYLMLDELLACQNCRTEADSELLFITIHQANELWFKLMVHELDRSLDALYDGDALRAYKTLARVSRIQSLLINTWEVLATLTPTEYEVFRETVGRDGASGFQSVQNREVEFLLGEKRRVREVQLADGRSHQFDVIDMHADPNARARLQARWVGPDIYDGVLHLLGRGFPDAGIDSPPREADHSAPRTESPAAHAVWLEIYTAPERHMPEYQLGEKLIDIEDAQRRWRFLHLTTVARVIGSSTGTGGSAGLRYLQKTAVESMEQFLYPELWAIRTDIVA